MTILDVDSTKIDEKNAMHVLIDDLIDELKLNFNLIQAELA